MTFNEFQSFLTTSDKDLKSTFIGTEIANKSESANCVYKLDARLVAVDGQCANNIFGILIENTVAVRATETRFVVALRYTKYQWASTLMAELHKKDTVSYLFRTLH